MMLVLEGIRLHILTHRTIVGSQSQLAHYVSLSNSATSSMCGV